MKQTIRLSPVAPLAPIVGEGELVAFNVGPDGVTYFVVALKRLDVRIEQPGGASFAKTVPKEPQKYRVFGLSGSQIVLDVSIEGERFNIHDIQPLTDALLLVCARSYFKGPDHFEKNGRIYSRSGKFLREILLGDGIRSVQATSNGLIWTSYFDEGIFGNYGWSDPIGATGLVTWDRDGKKVYEYEPCDGLDSICDCYALNVESDEDVWLYYYTEFPLVRIRRGEIESIWNMPIHGSNAFAISEGYALFAGGYDNPQTYLLFSLGSGGMPQLTAELELRGENGGILEPAQVIGRADAIHLVSDGFLYRVDVQSALEVLRTG